MRVLMNVYLVLFFFIFGPEAVANSLPMKKVQTIETVWVPVEQGEIDDSTEVIEAVELKEGQQGAVPLFKESQMGPPPPSREDPRPNVVSQEMPKPPPGVQIKTAEGLAPDERPIIQVIYQGVKPPSPPKKKMEPLPAPPSPIAEEPAVPIGESKPLNPQEKPKKPRGDTYNFYFSS